MESWYVSVGHEWRRSTFVVCRKRLIACWLTYYNSPPSSTFVKTTVREAAFMDEMLKVPSTRSWIQTLSGETTGLAFSPDNMHMYVSYQGPGKISTLLEPTDIHSMDKDSTSNTMTVTISLPRPSECGTISYCVYATLKR